MTKILVAISAHGYGHLGQISPVLNRLAELVPDLELFIQADMPRPLIASRVDAEFESIEYAADLGILMDGPTVMRWPETIAAYQQFHADWSKHLQRQQQYLSDVSPDLVITDIPYLTITAAKALQIPVVAFCSLNWADILQANSDAAHQLSRELAVIRDCYQSAELFIQPEPSMPMPWLRNRQPIGPVFRQAASQRELLNKRLALKPGDKLILVALGGIPETHAVQTWPRISEVQWIVSGGPVPEREDLHNFYDLELPFTTVLASVDLIISKPGYGTYTEVAGVGIPMISVERSDWAETEVLNSWLAARLPLRTISLEQYLSGNYVELISELLHQPRSMPTTPTGIKQVVAVIQGLLGRESVVNRE